MALKGILEEPRIGGYPQEYLVSRIRARGAMLLADWKSLLLEPDPFASAPERYGTPMTEAALDSVWRHMLREYSWVYAQMDAEARIRFGPFFSYAELRTLFSLLRSRAERGKPPKLDKLSGTSLISGEIKDALVSGLPDEEIIRLVSERLGIPFEIRKDAGLGRIEAATASSFIAHTVESRRGTLMAEYFSYLADARNIISLYKAQRWNMSETPDFTEGGTISMRLLGSVLDKKEMPGVWELLRKLTGDDLTEVKDIQTALVSGLLKKASAWRRGVSDDGIILDYLIRSMAEARNLALLLYGRGMDREILSGGMVF